MKKFMFVITGLVFIMSASSSTLSQTARDYTLDEVYYYLTEGTEATWGAHSLEPLEGTPGEPIPGFCKSLENIYDDIAAAFAVCSSTSPSDMPWGVPFFCTDAGNWGPQVGTMPTPIPDPTPVQVPPDQGGEWVRVPGDAGIGTNDFWVTKYEVKNVGGAYSQADTTPWVSINLADAAAACAALGSGYHLMTVDEVQTINRNLEQVASNWYGGVVGTNGIYRGNCELADNLGYNGSFPEYGTGRDTKARLKLSNGQEIWDWSGNLWEWIYGEGSNGTIGTSGGITWMSTSGWAGWADTDLNDERSIMGPSNSSWGATQGMGSFYGGPSSNGVARGGGGGLGGQR